MASPLAHHRYDRPSPVCQVCGGEANGCNYEVSSCVACKNFFRRVIIAEKRLVCRKNGRCKNATKEELVRCRACRFDRCVEQGMNPLAINAIIDTESNVLVREILDARGAVIRQGQKSSNNFHEPLCLVQQPSTMESLIDQALKDLLLRENAHQKLRRSRYNPDPHNPIVTLEWVLNGPSRMGLDYGDMPLVCPPLPLHMNYVPIEIRIRDRVKYVHVRADVAANPTYKIWNIIDVIYTIEWFKTFDVFQSLSENEKVVQIKSVSRMIAVFTAAFWSYEQRNSEVSIMPDGMILVEGVPPRDATVDRAYYFEIIQRIRQLRMDKQEYVLLKAIMTCEPVHDPFLFSPTSRSQIQNQRESFASALFKYVLSRRGTSEGPSAFSEMLGIIAWLTRIIRRSKELYVLVSAFKLKRAAVPAIMDQIFSP